MPTREECRAENEKVFRAGNEAIRHNIGPTSTLPLICECGSSDCMETIELTPEEYRIVRSHPAHFAVMEGHGDEDEEIVDEFDRFTVVEKTGVGRAIVEE
jgi:hypothetical protein